MANFFKEYQMQVKAEREAKENEGREVKMKDVIMFYTGRDGYGIDQCGDTLTVGELIDILSEYDEDTEIFYKNDNGYTYGRITADRIECEYVAEDE